MKHYENTSKIWYTETEASKYTTMCRDVLRNARMSGRLTYRAFGNKILYNVNDLDKFIERSSALYMSAEDHRNKK